MCPSTSVAPRIQYEYALASIAAALRRLDKDPCPDGRMAWSGDRASIVVVQDGNSLDEQRRIRFWRALSCCDGQTYTYHARLDVVLKGEVKYKDLLKLNGKLSRPPGLRDVLEAFKNRCEQELSKPCDCSNNPSANSIEANQVTFSPQNPAPANPAPAKLAIPKPAPLNLAPVSPPRWYMSPNNVFGANQLSLSPPNPAPANLAPANPVPSKPAPVSPPRWCISPRNACGRPC